MRHTYHRIFRIACCVVLSGCSNYSANNLFSHYSAQTQPLYSALNAGDYAQAMQISQSDSMEEGTGNILENLEKGRIALLNQDNSMSMSWLEESDKQIQQQQDRALISLSENASSLSGLLLNDSVNDYVAADYELGFLHLYLALGYIQRNELDEALVEFRRANKVQEQAKALREKELQQDKNRTGEQGVAPDISSVLAHYPPASAKLSAVQNGYLFYLSGLMFEADGNLNDAYIDYKRALAVNPDNPTVIQSTLRCARKLGMSADLQTLTARYGHEDLLKNDQSRIIVIQEQSVVDYMQGWHQSLMMYDHHGKPALYSFALPYYDPMKVVEVASPILNSQPLSGSLLVDVNLMARNQLQERITSIVFRQIVRLLLKDQMRQQIAKEDQLSGLLVSVWNTLTDQPDTRSWLTLPAQVYSSSQVVTAGKQSIEVLGKTYSFDASAQSTTFVWISQQGNNSVIWHKQLGKL